MAARNAGRGASAGQGDTKHTAGPLTLDQVARRHGVPRAVLGHALLAGRGPRHRVVQGTVLVTVADADAWAVSFPLCRGRAAP